jgi:hypothetical protein
LGRLEGWKQAGYGHMVASFGKAKSKTRNKIAKFEKVFGKKNRR